MTTIKTLYVFVDIGIDIAHFVDTIKHNFLAMDEDHSSSSSLSSSETKTLSKSMICLVATIQFVTSLQAAKLLLQEAGFDVLVPQARVELGERQMISSILPLSDALSSSSLSLLMHLPLAPLSRRNPWLHCPQNPFSSSTRSTHHHSLPRRRQISPRVHHDG